MKTNIILSALILVFSALISLPLIKPGLYTMHDDQQVARLYEIDKSTKAGDFLPRWTEDLGFGFGYPLFIFYPPLVYYLGEAFHLLGAGFIDSVKIVFFLSIFLSGVAMYILVKEIYGRLEGTVAAVFYILVPYRALDVYVRGALAESFSFVWLPLILWAFFKLYRDQKFIYVPLSALFLSLLMITHNLIFLPFMLILASYLILLILHSANRRKFIVYSLLSIVYSFLLSAFFWIPALTEKKFTIVDNLLLTDLANYRMHFVYPTQLWNWTWGFGGSAAGLADGISFKIGKLHILVPLAAITLALMGWFHNRNKIKSPFTIYHLLFTFFILFLLSAFMTTFYSKPIWDLIQPLAYLQFPWRFLIFCALTSSVLAGAFIFLLRVSFLKLIASTALIALILTGNIKLFKPQSYRATLTDPDATSEEVINWEVSKSSFEYIPKGIDIKTDESGKRIPPIEKSQIPTQKIEIAQGAGSISDVEIKPSKIKFIADIHEQSVMNVNVFDFPGWQVLVDGKNTSINDDNRLKLISFSLTPARHNVEVLFGRTKTRKIADTISLSSILGLAVLILRGTKLTNLNGQKRQA